VEFFACYSVFVERIMEMVSHFGKCVGLLECYAL
jgi:hypothetical protein